jgi:hypothetical protein
VKRNSITCRLINQSTLPLLLCFHAPSEWCYQLRQPMRRTGCAWDFATRLATETAVRQFCLCCVRVSVFATGCNVGLSFTDDANSWNRQRHIIRPGKYQLSLLLRRSFCLLLLLFTNPYLVTPRKVCQNCQFLNYDSSLFLCISGCTSNYGRKLTECLLRTHLTVEKCY